MSSMFRTFFKNNFTMLKVACCWILDGRPLPKFYKYYFHVVHVLFVGTLNLLMCVNWVLASTDLKKFASLGYIILVGIMAQVKLLVIFYYRDDFGELVRQLDDDSFQPKTIAETNVVTHTLDHFAGIRKFLVRWCLASTIQTIFSPLFTKKNEGLPVPAYYPISIAQLDTYVPVYMHQAISVSYFALLSVYVDLMVAGYVTFIGIQCDVLCHRLKGIRKNNQRELRYCIRHHMKIFKFLKTTEKVFGKIYFGQLFASTTALCMDLFLLSLTEPKTFEFFYLVVYLLAVANLLLVPCWFSTEMTRKSENIPFAAYSCDWVDSSNSFKKELIFFIRRAQRPLKFYAVDFFEISVETFVKIIRTSLSYYAVLNNLNMEEKYY
ncbi:odorant receptor 49b-like isoform X3 [Cylas formicarius]|uniref:odorant receptor 49b-like isoform X3 n=1 Tax=Cylas formicarius TaxID=197179 RepID=UPI0029583E89|nr:odorant receptor 49b-like isoform X3 [Cylas formicarius]